MAISHKLQPFYAMIIFSLTSFLKWRVKENCLPFPQQLNFFLYWDKVARFGLPSCVLVDPQRPMCPDGSGIMPMLLSASSVGSLMPTIMGIIMSMKCCFTVTVKSYWLQQLRMGLTFLDRKTMFGREVLHLSP